jgi:hypothetical protein
LEVWKETLFGSMCSTPNGTSDHSLDRKWGSLKKSSKTLHNELKILVNDIMKNLKKSIKCSARRSLGFGIIDQIHDSLQNTCQP